MHLAPEPVVIQVPANYLASVIDGQRITIDSAGKIERCVNAVAVEKAMIDAITVYVSSEISPTLLMYRLPLMLPGGAIVV